MLTTEGPGSSNCTVSTGTLPTSNGSEDDDCGLADAGTPSVPEKRWKQNSFPYGQFQTLTHWNWEALWIWEQT